MKLLGESTRRWWILMAMGGVLGLTVLDETVVGVALPTIRADLAVSQITSHWVVNSYLLVFACLIVGAGKLSDIVGIRTLFMPARPSSAWRRSPVVSRHRAIGSSSRAGCRVSARR